MNKDFSITDCLIIFILIVILFVLIVIAYMMYNMNKDTVQEFDVVTESTTTNDDDDDEEEDINQLDEISF